MLQASLVTGPGRITKPFHCTLTGAGSPAALVRVGGELDLQTSPELESNLREAQLHARLVVLDAREVTFIDSAGIHVILDASELCECAGGRLTLVPSATVERVLEIAGVSERIATFDLSPTEPTPALPLP
jgi:anti-sigma B factor antagonist